MGILHSSTDRGQISSKRDVRLPDDDEDGRDHHKSRSSSHRNNNSDSAERRRCEVRQCNDDSTSTRKRSTSNAAPGGSGGGGGRPSSASVLSCRTIDDTRVVRLGPRGPQIRYAYMTQRGFYPDDAEHDVSKPNQDALSVTHHLSNRPDRALFAVYDGHGRTGDRCARFAARALPETMRRQLDRIEGFGGSDNCEEKEDDRDDAEATFAGKNDIVPDVFVPSADHHEYYAAVERACVKAHVQCNVSMHKNKYIDDTLSGTTAVSVYFHQTSSPIPKDNADPSNAEKTIVQQKQRQQRRYHNHITICNVGDSRAVLGRVKKHHNSDSFRRGSSAFDGPPAPSLRGLPLSNDQTPYRRDERVRVKRCGARILSLDQIEGYEPLHDDGDDDDSSEEIDRDYGDPPRVWSPDGEYPGTAFTRSLGDSIAEGLGVFAEAEVFSRPLRPGRDRVVVLASDGVFEFLTNQSVVDICAKYEDPLEACRAVVAEAYELWMQYERRTDDITILCIFLDEEKEEKEVGEEDEDAEEEEKSKDNGRNLQKEDDEDNEEDSDDDLSEGDIESHPKHRRLRQRYTASTEMVDRPEEDETDSDDKWDYVVR